ncbi:MAG TPA: bifunctional 4-hydroxy-3-methylbut-2-enyl diphosphate reductase/30S ribosomal protein S1 [Verrucomicrobiae bacterium]|nr:bifunctional 4-hydroxy-3-methylbut-2-enyl diphosphate reductase/30S ribosomal protein S1 [Verrucomicrobiae bacterium]
MEVVVARSAGFCFGVKRAIDMAEKTSQQGTAYTYGPLIHNRQVVEHLETKGLRAVNNLEEVQDRVIIRSHGVPPEVYDRGQELGLELVDATCPFVQKAQRLAQQYQQEGRQVVVVGDASHPEVKGIIGWTGNRGIVVENPAQAEELPPLGPVAVLAQTTQPEKNFRAVVEILHRKSSDLVERNTICSATGERQDAALELAKQVEVMVVVGGKDSANTKKLAALCSGTGTRTYQIEKADELEPAWFTGISKAGLTAGASTPDWIIEEVFTTMSEFNLPPNDENSQEFEDMASWEKSLQDIKRGQVVSGTVVRITPDEVLVDIGGKSEGLIPINELAVKTPAHPSEVVSEGERIDVLILKVEGEDGYPLLSKRRAEQFKAVDGLEEAFKTGKELSAKAVEVVKGGLLVDVGMRGFVPASQIQRGFVEDLSQFVGQTLRLRIIDFDREKNKVVLSQKVILEEEAKVSREKLWETIQEGQVIKGTVRRLANFGAFIDIGGVDGLLHVSDMSYGRVKHPSEIVKEGDEVEVSVLKVDRDKQKVSLGLKQITPSPWENAAEKYPVGVTVAGTVVRLAPFGAFVKLEEGIDGLIHISQLADRRVVKPEEVVQIGQEVKVKVTECKPEEKRLSLSLKDVKNDQENAAVQDLLDTQVDEFRPTIGDALGHAAEE